LSPAQAAGYPLPDALTGLSIEFQSGGGISAPLLYASAGQVNLEIPWELSGLSSVLVTASFDGNNGPAQTFNLAKFAPAIFATNAQGTGQGAILDSSSRLVDASNPTTQGNVIAIYCTGLGPVSNPPATGSPASAVTLSQTPANPTVTIGGIESVVLFSGLAPGSVGEYQVNAIMPAGVTPGVAVPVTISIGGIVSNTVTIAVQ